MEKILPVTIIISSYNRKNLLKKTIELINKRTFYPYRIIVVDNNSTDGSVDYLKTAKVYGKIFDALLLDENLGQSRALNKVFALVEKWENELRRPSNDFIVTTNEDIFVPDLGMECWLTRMIDILERNEPEYGGICGRIQRTPRTDIDESKEIIPCYKGFPSVYRLMRRSDLRKLGERPFGRLLKWDSNTMGDKYKIEIRKKFGFTTHIYFDHAGFMLEKKGYGEDVETFTVAENKLNERYDKPYPDIDPLTNIPIKINHPCDAAEQKLREDYQSGANKPEVTLITLTCKRPEGLRAIIKSIMANTTDIAYKLLVVADNDDTEAYNYCVENDIQCILSNICRDFVAQANMGIYACDTPYFVILADDMEILEPGWLGNALNIFKDRFPDGVGLMAFNDGIQNGRIFATGMSSKKFVHHMGGHLYYPKYIHYGGDNEVSFTAKQLDLYHYAESVKVAHFHPTNKNQELANKKDETYLNSEKFNSHDQRLKRERKGDVENLIKNKNYYDYF